VLLLVAFGVGGSLLAACSPAPSAAPQPTPATAGAAVPAAPTSAPSSAASATAPAQAATKTGGTLTVAQVNDPGYLALNAIGTDTYNVTQHIFDSLLRFDASGQYVPGLAESWSTSDDGLTWTFKLRQGVKFHNGEDFTSAAVKFSVQKLQGPQVTRRIFLSSITDVQTPDDFTVQLVTSRPTPTLPLYLAYVFDVYPPNTYAQMGDDAFNKSPVGTGAFKFVDWQRDQRLSLQANETYWGGRPSFDNLVIRFIPEPSTRVAELIAGNADIINIVPIELIPQIESTGSATAPSSKGTSHVFVNLRSDMPPTDDVRVRQAMNYAVDVDSIIKQLYAGRATRLASAVGQQAFGFDASIQPYAYDVDKAKQLLADAGVSGGVNIRLDTAGADTKQLAETLVGYWQKVGINAEIVNMEAAAYVQNEQGKKLDNAGLTNWAGPTFDADAVLSPRVFSKAPTSYYNNPQMDQLIQQAGSTLDQGQRTDLYKQALQLFHDQAGWVFLFVPYYNFGVSNKVSWTPYADGSMVMLKAAPKS
jgi:peptide/nickel transport system substrate-binding protein